VGTHAITARNCDSLVMRRQRRVIAVPLAQHAYRMLIARETLTKPMHESLLCRNTVGLMMIDGDDIYAAAALSACLLMNTS
jgi:hypothetical protein